MDVTEVRRSEKQTERRASLCTHRVCCIAAMLATVSLAACGGGDRIAVSDRTAIGVNGIAVATSTVDHWRRVFALGGPLAGPHLPESGAPRAQAVAFLISSRWLIGEVKRQGLAISRSESEKALARQRKETGGSEFAEVLRAGGQTAADVKLELEAELAEKAIQQMLTKRAAVTQREVATYYRQHIQRFRVPETRVTDLIEQLSSPAEAVALVKRIGTGRRFAKRAFREPIQLYVDKGADPERREVEREIFKAKVGVASRPIKLGIGLGNAYTVFVVRRIVPARYESFAAARSTAKDLLVAERQQMLARRYFRAYQSRWTAATSCRAGYVVQGCAQYRGPLKAAANPFSIAGPTVLR
jgi:hypothetical protein